MTARYNSIGGMEYEMGTFQADDIINMNLPRAIDAVNVPTRLRSLGKVIGEETTAVFLGKCASKPLDSESRTRAKVPFIRKDERSIYPIEHAHSPIRHHQAALN